MQESRLPKFDTTSDDDTAFMKEAYCQDMHPSEFFGTRVEEIEAAKRICANCVVQVPCLEYALKYRIEHGVWGGASERDRRRILRERRLSNNG